MKQNYAILGTAIFISSLILFACSPKQGNETATKGESVSQQKSVTVIESWARATFSMAQTGAVYMTIHNNTTAEVILNSASIDRSIAQEAQLHDMSMSDGMMQMEEMEDGITIAPNSHLSFEPGGKHIMLVGLEEALLADKRFQVTLNFENQPAMKVDVIVKDARNL